MASRLKTTLPSTELEVADGLSSTIVQNHMLRLSHYFKVLQTIIILNTIYMVNYFIWIKIPSQVLFHNKTVFKDITLFIRKRMSSILNINISSAMQSYSTLPLRIFRTLLVSFGENCKVTGSTPFSNSPMKSLITSFTKFYRRFQSTRNTLSSSFNRFLFSAVTIIFHGSNSNYTLVI
jgi:hypothetical protein